MEEQGMTAHRRYYDLSDARRRRFRRRERDGIILGVCAGVADFFSLDRSIVRLVALLLLWFFTIPTVLLYFILAWLGDAR
jgi:phage shock protein PspC (stress-responsive transcriptional regulator)